MVKKRKSAVMVIAVVVASILFVSFVQAQETKKCVKEQGGMGYSIFGNSTIDIANLNTKLEGNGYTKLPESYFCVGGGGHSIINKRWIVGGEGYTLLGDESTGADFKASTYVFQGFANIGYIIFSKKGLSVYPLLGLGGGSMKLTFSEKNASYAFDDVLTDPKREATLTAGGFLVNLALGVDYYLKLGEDEEGHGGFLLGVRAGYTLAPSKGGWSMNGADLTGSPDFSMTGPFVRIIFGGGGFEKRD